MLKIGPAVTAAAVLAIASPVCAQDAVQWRVEDGGNGHWYRFDQIRLRWEAHRDGAYAAGAHLATITSEAEREFVTSILSIQGADIWLGGQTNGPSPITWITGEEFVYVPSYWCQGNPGGGYAIEICGRSICRNAFCWNVESETSPGWDGNKAVYEWSADCNGDGIVDFGQIRDGTFPDLNTNGVPDCCEPGESCTPCPGDVTNGGTVDAADLSILLAAWGTNGQGEFDTDRNDDGLVDGGDLALVLGGWGPCP